MDAVLTLSPDAFAVALARQVRVKVSDRRPAPFLLIQEDGTGRVAVFRVRRSWPAITPILNRIDGIDRVRAYPVLGELIALHTPRSRTARRGATAS